jgi:hypothetical protein
VLDVDSAAAHRRDGLSAYENFEVINGEIRAYTIRTASGGLHKYFHHVEGLKCSQNQIAPGLDTRAEGGYVIAPGARYPDGSGWIVEWDHDIAEVPDWLLAKWPKEGSGATSPASATGPAAEGETRAGLFELERIIFCLFLAPDGKQHHALFVAAAGAGNLVAGGEIRLETAREALLRAGLMMPNFNPGHPWRASELRRVIENGLRKGLTEPRAVTIEIRDELAIADELERAMPSLRGEGAK